MTTNTNTDTNIRYGIISAASLEPELIQCLQDTGHDLSWEEAAEQLRNEIKIEIAELGGMTEGEAEDYEEREFDTRRDHIQIEEPIHEFEFDGVKGRTTWLGGALHVWVFFSPKVTRRALCSPCVPGAMDLDAEPGSSDYIGYDVPCDWRVINNAPITTEEVQAYYEGMAANTGDTLSERYAWIAGYTVAELACLLKGTQPLDDIRVAVLERRQMK